MIIEKKKKINKILIISNYPIALAFHGGQKRTKAIVELYKNLSYEVRFVAIFSKNDYKNFSTDDIYVRDKKLVQDLTNYPFAGDVICGKAIYEDSIVKNKIIQLINSFKPEIIQIEQPFLYIGLKKIIDELKIINKPMLIYSSQNIEYIMKEQIFNDLSIPNSQKISFLNTIKSNEKSLLKKADLVIAVSKSDKKIFKKNGARHIIIIPNGIYKTNPTKQAIRHWDNLKSRTGIKHFITYVSSAHPPNLIGFQKMIGLDLEFLPKSSKIMLAGGISNYIQTIIPNNNSNKSLKFWNNVLPLGELSDDNLAALIRLSEVILLPITEGGGSNLKTAEAILSQRKIVSTNFAFRTYEKYSNFPNIYFANDSKKFKNQILNAINRDYKKLSEVQIKKIDKVQWEYCLFPLSLVLKIYSDRILYILSKIFTLTFMILILRIYLFFNKYNFYNK